MIKFIENKKGARIEFTGSHQRKIEAEAKRLGISEREWGVRFIRFITRKLKARTRKCIKKN